jgi:hypothetical protein
MELANQMIKGWRDIEHFAQLPQNPILFVINFKGAWRTNGLLVSSALRILYQTTEIKWQAGLQKAGNERKSAHHEPVRSLRML